MGQTQTIFKQLFEKESSTYTYLIADKSTKEAILIDPVLETFDRDVRLLKELDLNLKYAINTHCHADHITSSGLLKKFNSKTKSIISEKSQAKADIKINEGDKIKFGNITLECLSTPGHTDGCVTYVCHSLKSIFTGDALLIRGCGRTDFQQGDSSCLYDSIQKKIFTLPDDYIIWPAHDYNGNTSSTVFEEKKFNPRLTLSKDEFINVMNNLNLPMPKKIGMAVPANLVCGVQD